MLGAGDAYFASKCAARMKRLTYDSGATLLFVSHDISSVQQMCNRAIWVERGQIIMDGTPLDVGKAYYAETLRLEEERLALRNSGKISGSLVEAQPDVLLFRFVRSDFGQLQGEHNIYRITLKDESGNAIASILPGAPMDNDLGQRGAIISGNTTLWGEAERDGDRYCRKIKNTGGEDNQAAFQFVGVRLADRTDLQLEVEYAADEKDEVAVEVHSDSAYVRSATLPKDSGLELQCYVVSIVQPKPAEGGGKNEQVALGEEKEDGGQVSPIWFEQEGFYRIRRSVDKFASNYAEIIGVDICGKGGPQAIFSPGEDFILKITIKAHRFLGKAYLDISLYTSDDVVVYVGYWPLADRLEQGIYCYEISFNAPPLHQGEYVFSFALLDNFHAPSPIYFSEWNRTHQMYINETYFGQMGLGLVHLPTTPLRGATLIAACPKTGV